MTREAELLQQLYEGTKMAHSAAKQLAFMRAVPQYLQLAELLEKISTKARHSATLARIKQRAS